MTLKPSAAASFIHQHLPCHKTCIDPRPVQVQLWLGGMTWDDWDLIATQYNQTNDRFHQSITSFLTHNIKPTDLADQEHYIHNSKKALLLPLP